MDQKQLDHHANQGNRTSKAHQAAAENRSRQKDPASLVYAKSRGSAKPGPKAK